MTYQEAANLISESLVMVDHPHECMVVRAGIDMTPAFTELAFTFEDVFNATRLLIEGNPRLAGFFRLDTQATHFVEPKNITPEELKRLCSKVWEFNDLEMKDFLHVRVPFDEGPLFRMRFRSDEGLYLAVHHAFSDGRGLTALFSNLFVTLLSLRDTAFKVPKLLFDDSVRHAIEENPFKKVLSRILNAYIRIAGFVFPPVLLGPKYSLFSSTHTQLTLTFPDAEIESLFVPLKARYESLTRNDYFMTCLHLAIHDALLKQISSGVVHGGKSRISIMMPIDFRGQKLRSNLALANLSSAVPIYSFFNERRSPLRLLQILSRRSFMFRKLRLELQSLNALKIVKKLGIVEASRKTLISHGLPRRAVHGPKGFWRFAETGIMTNVGEIRELKNLTRFVKSISGYAPPVPPMGFTMCVSAGFGVTFNVQSSAASLSREETQWLLDRFEYWLRELPRLAQRGTA